MQWIIYIPMFQNCVCVCVRKRERERWEEGQRNRVSRQIHRISKLSLPPTSPPVQSHTCILMRSQTYGCTHVTIHMNPPFYQVLFTLLCSHQQLHSVLSTKSLETLAQDQMQIWYRSSSSPPGPPAFSPQPVLPLLHCGG